MIDFAERFAASPDCANAVRERASALWQHRWLCVEQAVSGTPYLLPDGFCATDVYIAVLCRWDMDSDWRQETLPRVNALANAVRNRSALVPVFARHTPNKAAEPSAQDPEPATGSGSV